VQAGVLSRRREGHVLLDVTPLSLGVETLRRDDDDDRPQHDDPTRRRNLLHGDGQSASVEVHVLQGERTEAR